MGKLTTEQAVGPKSKGDKSLNGQRKFFSLLQQFLSKAEVDKELIASLIAIWRKQGEKHFIRFGIFRDTDAYFNLFLSDLRNADKAVWGRLLQGMTEVNTGLVHYCQLKNLSPYADQLLVFANQLGEARIDDYEIFLAFAKNADKYPYQTVIAVSVAEQEVVVL